MYFGWWFMMVYDPLFHAQLVDASKMKCFVSELLNKATSFCTELLFVSHVGGLSAVSLI